jgi:hypothetical protein
MSENSIPHGEHHEPCTLRRSYKSAFLHPEEEIQGLINLPRTDKQSALKVVPLPKKRQTDPLL